MSDDCPHKEDSLDDEEWKGTCELDGGDCIFPLNPKDWRACNRLHQDVFPVSRIVDAHQQIRAQVLEEVYKRLEAMTNDICNPTGVIGITGINSLFSELKGDVRK